MPQLVDPFQSAMANLQSFQSIQRSQAATKRNEAMLAKQEAEKQQALRLQNDLALLAAKPNTGAKDYAALMAEYPSMSDHFKKSFELMDSRKKQAKHACLQ